MAVLMTDYFDNQIYAITELIPIYCIDVSVFSSMVAPVMVLRSSYELSICKKSLLLFKYKWQAEMMATKVSELYSTMYRDLLNSSSMYAATIVNEQSTYDLKERVTGLFKRRLTVKHVSIVRVKGLVYLNDEVLIEALTPEIYALCKTAFTKGCTRKTMFKVWKEATGVAFLPAAIRNVLNKQVVKGNMVFSRNAANCSRFEYVAGKFVRAF